MTYSNLISIENLFQAWDEFKRGKRKKYDVMLFERNLEDNLFNLYGKLKIKTYRHGSYSEFYVNDPKRRQIHKANVEDRVVHHLLYKYLYSLFDKTFIYDSYSCRLEKGTHKAARRLEKFTRIVSKNYSQDCWALKLDIKKFFASVDHGLLKDLVHKNIKDKNIDLLIDEVIDSFCTCHSGLDPESKKIQNLNPFDETLFDKTQSKQGKQVQDDNRFPQPKGWGSLIFAQNSLHLRHECRSFFAQNKKLSQCKGIPLGNLTSQIFANIYLNELDQFVKHELKVRHYLRYADDFIILNTNLHFLLSCFETVKQFLGEKVKLELHPDKIILRKLSWGVDFCGYVILPHHVLPRTRTKRRIFKKVLSSKLSDQSLQSYLGYFSHASSHNLTLQLQNLYFLN